MNVSETNIRKAIEVAMKELKITETKATCELIMYMCGHGTVDEFKDVINYYIKNQERLDLYE